MNLLFILLFVIYSLALFNTGTGQEVNDKFLPIPMGITLEELNNNLRNRNDIVVYDQKGRNTNGKLVYDSIIYLNAGQKYQSMFIRTIRQKKIKINAGTFAEPEFNFLRDKLVSIRFSLEKNKRKNIVKILKKALGNPTIITNSVSTNWKNVWQWKKQITKIELYDNQYIALFGNTSYVMIYDTSRIDEYNLISMSSEFDLEPFVESSIYNGMREYNVSINKYSDIEDTNKIYLDCAHPIYFKPSMQFLPIEVILKCSQTREVLLRKKYDNVSDTTKIFEAENSVWGLSCYHEQQYLYDLEVTYDGVLIRYYKIKINPCE